MQKNSNASDSSKQRLEVSKEMRNKASEIIANGSAYKYLIGITKNVPKKLVV
jgi:hypothetical protein